MSRIGMGTERVVSLRSCGYEGVNRMGAGVPTTSAV